MEKKFNELQNEIELLKNAITSSNRDVVLNKFAQVRRMLQEMEIQARFNISMKEETR